MKRLSIFLSVFVFMSQLSAAHAGLLQKATEAELKKIGIPGHTVVEEQAFKVSTGPLAGKILLFASFDPSRVNDRTPGFFVVDNGKMIDSKALPTVQEGWNLVDVSAVSAVPGQDKSALRVLAVTTLEPLSNRPEDYWDQAFVLDVGNDGKIETNPELNLKISKKKPAIKTIEGLKAFLAQQK